MYQVIEEIKERELNAKVLPSTDARAMGVADMSYPEKFPEPNWLLTDDEFENLLDEMTDKFVKEYTVEEINAKEN